MGVKISGIIPKKEISFDDLANKKVVIDASNMLYQFVASIRSPDGTSLMDSKGKITSHLVGTFSRLSNLMNRGIKICVAFDGKPPILKLAEREDREHKKRVAEAKLRQAIEEEDTELVSRYSKQTSRLSSEMINETKELIKALGLPVIQSPSEADAQMAFMAEKKDVDYVATSDFDPMLYGCPRLITNLTLSQRKKLPSGSSIKINPELIELDSVLKTLGIKQDQLMVLAILIGTDYNKGGVKGIGPKTALRLVKTYSSFDKLFEEVKAEFDWKKVYATFKSMPIMKNYQLKWKAPNETEIKKLLVKKHDFSEERVQLTLNKLIKEQDKKKQKSLADF